MNKEQTIRELFKNDKEFKYQEDLGAEDNLVEKGVMDSFGMITLVTLLEKKFDVRILPEEMVEENFTSIKSITEFIKRKTA